jgi:signal transduction histidine kinase/ActR/RegA family two-component response regulator
MKPAIRHQKTRRRNTSFEEAPEAPSLESSGVADPMHAPVSEAMNRGVVCVPASFSVTALEELLLDCDPSGVPVVNEHGRAVGFVAMTDVVRELHYRADASDARDADSLAWGFHEEPEPRTVAHVMAPITFELPASCPVAKAIGLMAMQHVHRAPVVSADGALLGVVTAHDIVRYLARAGRTTPEPKAVAEAGSEAHRAAERQHLAKAGRLVSLDFLAGGIAHQINNALTPMRLSLGRLVSFELSRRPLSVERLHRIELLQDVREGVARIEHILRELKVFSHTNDSPNRPVDVQALLDVALGLASHEIRHRARLVCDYAAAPLVRAKPAELRQVFLNLLINAVQAIPEGEVHVNEIRVTTRTDDHRRAVIEIKDSGTGIPPDVTARVFEPFFTTRAEGKGLGLGLAVARDIVSAQGGEITIDSVVGKGTTVRVALPPCAEDWASPEVPDEPRPAPAVFSNRRRILILDDDRPVAAALALELEAHDVVVAGSGREALEILRRDKEFDLILCDLMMPEISGMDVYEALRLIDPTLLSRMVLMTGGAFTTRARQFISKVDTPLIEKPFHPGQLNEIVQALEHTRTPADATAPAPVEELLSPCSAPLGEDC